MAKIPGSICSSCYADKGFYSMYANTIKPAQFARWDAVMQAMESEEQAALWVDSIVALIGSDKYFRWHDSGDLQGVIHLQLIARVAEKTPHCRHWLPTREYGIVKEYIQAFGAIPKNLTIRLSAVYPDEPVRIPASLASVPGITASNVHDKTNPVGEACKAPEQGGECRDCRACWTDAVVSYKLH
jgi:hypothetical protein